MEIGISGNGNLKHLGRFQSAHAGNCFALEQSPIILFEWVKWVPKKINIFGWRAKQNRLPTLAELQKRTYTGGFVQFANRNKK
ncbi:hypothetical protein HanRHA438_Chr03g0103761 [Helianthus annuus]|nr:hypothetical protein HanRHA438_Chr03g0103761 [Helianthus annuus]